MSHAEPTPIEALLAHGGWVRELARRLVRDEADADDLVQDTWAAALRSPPEERGGVRAWLATVLRNRHRERFRAASRREARESAVARPDRTPAADEIVSRADAHRHVVTTVLTLDEPYRSTVLLLFFEGLTPNEVAARLGIPVDTVRTRARRALETLRARLDRDHGGDRRAWAVAVLGMDAWTRWGGATVGASSTALGTLGTGVVMATTTTTVIAAMGGLAAGVVLTLLASGDGSVPPLEAGDTASSSSADTARAQPRGTNDVSGRRDRPGAADAAGGTSATTGSVTGVADADLDVALPPLATGRIHGRVLLANGSPVAGVTVRGSVIRNVARTAPEAGPPRRITEDELVADARRRARWDAATTVEAVTDADGRYELTQVRQAEHSMRAWAAGMDLRPGPGQQDWNASPGETFDFVARIKVAVEVSVVDARGAAPDEVRLNWRPAGERGGGFGAMWSPANPTVYAEPGTWEVTAEVRGDDERRSDTVSVTVAAGVQTPPVTLRLRGVPGIRGRIDVPTNQRWSYLHVLAVRHDGGEPSDLAFVEGLRAGARAPGYEFEFDALESGTYSVGVTLGSREIRARTTVVVGEGRSECSLKLPALGFEDVVRLRVSGPDGAPVEDVRFGFEVRRGTGIATHGAGEAHLQADGSWLYPLPDSGDDDGTGAPAECTILVESATLGTRRVPLERGRVGSLDVRLAEPSTVEVTVVGADFAASRDRLSVVLTPVGGDRPMPMRPPNGRDVPTLGADGRCTIPLVAPGTYDAQLWFAAARPYALRVASERVTVRSGTADVVLRLPALVDVRVRAPDLVPGDRLELVPARAPGNYYFSSAEALDDAGEAAWDDLPAGDYVLAGTVSGERREMRVQVTTAGTYTFVPGVLDGLEVTVDDATGQLAAAGFGTGDVIVRIAGDEFTTRHRARALASAARDRESIEIVVLRGGREVTLRAEPTLLSGFIEVGGSWVPVRR